MLSCVLLKGSGPTWLQQKESQPEQARRAAGPGLPTRPEKPFVTSLLALLNSTIKNECKDNPQGEC